MFDIFNAVALGNRIRYYRNKKNLSQKALAIQIHIAQSRISALEAGKSNYFNIKKLSAIADVLEVTLDDLLCDSILKLNQDNVSGISFGEQMLSELILNSDQNELQVYERIIDDFIEYLQNIRSIDS